MIPETSVNWKAFEYIYSDNPQRAFENLTYYLFCHEFNQKNGIFRYFNQPHIETNPIRLDDKLIGFQSKYYADSVTMSGKESELIEAVKGAAKAYSGITTLYFYISHEFSPSSKKDIVKPSYQVSIENVAQNLGIEIEWRGISNIEAQLMQDSQLTVCRNVFFQVDSAVQKCCESLDRHKNDIFDRISTNVMYKGNKIVLDHNALNLDIFLNSSDQILIVYGDAGSGKSALIKQAVTHLSDRMDLRHYQEVVDVNSDGEGHEIYTVIPDFTEDMKKHSKQSQEAYDSHLKYMDLQLWSDYKFSGNEKFKEYDKYTDVTIVCKELRELGEYLRNFNDEDNIEQSNRSLIIHRYVSIASYTSAVLLRDYNKDLIDKDRELCEIIIFAFGYMFTQASDFEIVQAGNGIEAVITIMI